MFNFYLFQNLNIKLNISSLFNLSTSSKEGYRLIADDYAIYKDYKPLSLMLNLQNHSPLGFAWGYSGSGPSQSALAILVDYTNDIKFALEYYMQFKNEIISTYTSHKNHTLKYIIIQNWIDNIYARKQYQ